MRLMISKNPQLWASNYIKNKINATPNKFILGLPTGGTAVTMYQYLVNFYKSCELSFKNVVTFNMDEYIGLPKNHPQSYYTFMHQHLFNHVDMQADNINIPDGNAADIKEFCQAYEEKIKSLKGIDLFVGGVGENGHIAFNEPYSSLSSMTRDKELNSNTLQANSRFFNNDVNLVPKSAITVGIGTLLKSKEIMIIVRGEKKALALQQCMEGSISHLWPITAMQLSKNAIIIADREACAELKMKTFDYFNNLQDEYSYLEELVNEQLK